MQEARSSLRAAYCQSPNAPQAGDPAPVADRQLRPPMEHGTARHHAEDRLLNLLDEQITQRRLGPEALHGKTVRIAVDQEVCQACIAGVGEGHLGVLLQFSARYPDLRIEITDIRTGSFMVLQGGQRTVNQPRAAITDLGR